MSTNPKPRAAGEAAHTPTPWQAMPSGRIVHEYVPRGCRAVQCTSVAEVCDGFGQPKAANAAFIVRACNSHAALEMHREAADLFKQFLESLPKGWLGKTTGDVGLLNEAYIKLGKARAALALAKGLS